MRPKSDGVNVVTCRTLSSPSAASNALSAVASSVGSLGCELLQMRAHLANHREEAALLVVARLTIASALGSDGLVIGNTLRMCLASIAQKAVA